METEQLKSLIKELRRDIIDTIYTAKSGHPGGSLSCIDILSTLYFHKMKVDSNNPNWEDRDRFVLSKGHAAPALYVVLAKVGFFPKEDLKTLRQPGSKLQGHPYIKLSGVDATSGSLGQSLGVANGMAMAGKLDKKDYHTYVVLGDGELQEGNVWESALSTSAFKLNNLTAIVDRNGLQQTETVDNTKSLDNLKDKWESFGWNVVEINGHDIDEIKTALDQESDKPKMIIANTVKGKGVSFMENKLEWHGVAPNEEQYKKAMEELQ